MASQRPESPEPDGPMPIRKLQESLINRIAAGEIIHRPASALKELLENSLDAGATSIRVTVKDGGLKLLQIQDNGCGIRKEDLPILAERFTTSKLSSFSDLSRLRTYGFRGEALASLSHVAHLSVVTKTKVDGCAWKARYVDGALFSAKPGLTPDPKPCAGNDGTIITAEDLFYNTPTRLSALRSSSEEYGRILDVVTRYAVHNPTVAFVCKKGGSLSPDISTPSSSSVEQAIRLLYGTTIAKELLKVSFSSKSLGNDEDDDTMEVDEDEVVDKGAWKARAYVTSANYHAKKFVLLLFINHRLVDSARIKRGIENVYSSILPKGTSPFVYLSLEIDPRAVDVNVHPTKREVHFLDEESIIERVADAIQSALTRRGQGAARTFATQTQTLLTGGTLTNDIVAEPSKGKKRAKETDDEDEDEDESSAVSPVKQDPKRPYSKDKVRTDVKERKLDSMFPFLPPSSRLVEAGNDTDKDTSKYRTVGNGAAATNASQSSPMPKLIPESECYLTSVKDLRKGVLKAKHNLFTEIIQNHTFVGIVDLRRCLSLIQHSTKLYLVNHASLAEELFYQLGVRQFGNFHRLKLQPSPPIRRLIQLAVHTEEPRWKACGVNLREADVVDRIAKKLTARADMLDEYFSMRINERGELESLPLLMGDYTPNLDKLPLFLMRLGPQVDWSHERECFSTFLRELAYFYAPGPLLDDAVARNSADASDDRAEKVERWQIEHALFQTMRRYLVAPKTLLDRDVVQVASLPDLYRVFERC